MQMCGDLWVKYGNRRETESLAKIRDVWCSARRGEEVSELPENVNKEDAHPKDLRVHFGNMWRPKVSGHLSDSELTGNTPNTHTQPLTSVQSVHWLFGVNKYRSKVNSSAKKEKWL